MNPPPAVSRPSLVYNALVNWGGSLAQLLTAFIMAPLLVRGLGDEAYGIWSLVEQILAYVMIVDFGFGASMVRYVSRFETARDVTNLNRLFNTTLLVFSVAGLVGFAVVLLLAQFGLPALGISAEQRGEVWWLLVLLGANLSLGFPLNVFPALLDGLGCFALKAYVRTAKLLLRVPLFLWALTWERPLIPLGVALALCNFLEFFVQAYVTYRRLPHLRFSVRLVDYETFKLIRGYSFDAFLGLVAGRLSFQSDSIVISFFLGPQFIVFFSISARLVEYSKDLLRTVTTVLTPAFSALDCLGDVRTIRSLFLDCTRYVLWFVLPVQAFFTLLGRDFVGHWISPEHGASCYGTLLLLSASLALVAAQSVASRVLYGVGRLHFFSRLVMAEAVFNVVLSCLLVHPFGIEGVAFGTLLPNLACTLLILRHVLRLLDIRVGDYFLHTFFRPLLATGALSAVWTLAVSFDVSQSLPGFLFTSLGGAALYSLMALAGESGFAASVRSLFPKPAVRINSECLLAPKRLPHESGIDGPGYGLGGSHRPGGVARADIAGPSGPGI
jgi:O-antigen/teichoic acid export membrane protein